MSTSRGKKNQVQSDVPESPINAAMSSEENSQRKFSAIIDDINRHIAELKLDSDNSKRNFERLEAKIVEFSEESKKNIDDLKADMFKIITLFQSLHHKNYSALQPEMVEISTDAVLAENALKRNLKTMQMIEIRNRESPQKF